MATRASCERFPRGDDSRQGVGAKGSRVAKCNEIKFEIRLRRGQHAAHMGLRELAEELGISTQHVDGLGRDQHASDAALLTVMRALGVPIESAESADSYRHRSDASDALIQPCVATRALGGTSVALHGEAASLFKARLEREDGQVTELEAQLGMLPSHEGKWLLHLGALPVGYHRLRVECESEIGECVVLSAPERAYGAPDGRREWGVFAPLYAMRCAQSQGVGNLSALSSLMAWAGELGASYVGTLPLLAGDYEVAVETSPYSPTSRLFWNELYLDLVPLVEAFGSKELRERFNSAAYQKECARVEALDYVDYRATSSLKREILQGLSLCAWRSDEPRLRSYVEENPELHRYAQFRATMIKTGKTWPAWDAAQRGGALGPSDYEEDDYRYVVFGQWAANQQLAALSEQECKLYLDLSVGASGSSYDVWRYQKDFVSGVDIGAPPDGLFEGGQNWALPPLHPERSRVGGHAYFAQCVRTHMRYAGVLRIDHVMGLHRLYWVPSELGATEGLYVRYAAEELYAILKIESHRHQCALVGEDLGTVPDAVRPAMEAAGMHRLYVGQFATEWREAEQTLGLTEPPHNAVASLDTHDTATFAGWFQTTDLKVDPMALMRAWTEELAAGPAAGLLVTLEDLWLETEPQNRPGTTQEVPNWRHRMKMGQAELQSDSAIANWLAQLNSMRRG